MQGKKLDLQCRRQPWSNRIEMAILSTETIGGSRFGYVGKVVFHKIEEGQMVDDNDVIPMKNEEAQQLMDELWRCGLRPTEGAGSAGQMAATERHLADMRKIAFKFIEGE